MRQQLLAGVFALTPSDYARAVDVWEASVRATHHFVAEEDIRFFRPLVAAGLPTIEQVAAVRDESRQVAGFVAVVRRKVEMLFIHPLFLGQGAGRRLLAHAVATFNAVELDVNEQNDQAVGFYLRMGFQVIGRSELDGTSKPYPLLHMRLAGAGDPFAEMSSH